ncbi:MAG: TolC family protein [Bacteroidota bacterium]
MKSYIYLFLLWGMICPDRLLAQASDSIALLSLEEAITIAINNNHQIKISKYNADIQTLGNDPALVGRRPTIELNGSYQAGWSDASIETIPFGPSPDGNGANSLEGFSHTISVGPELSFLLFDGKASKLQLDQLGRSQAIAELQLRQAIENTVSAVVQAYITLSNQQSLMDISQQNIQLSQDRLDRAKEDAQYGTSSSLQALQIEVNLKTDSVAFRNQVVAYENAQRTLNYLLSAPIDRAYRVEDRLDWEETLDLEELERSLQENNSLLRLAAQQVSLGELGIALSKAAYRPRIQGFANFNYTYIQNDASFLLEQRTFGPNAGVSLNVPIVDGGARRIQKKQAQLTYQQRLLSQQDLEEELFKELHNAYAVYQNSLSQLRIEESNLESFERNLENFQNQYLLGLVTNTDVRSAQLSLNAAMNRISNFQYTLKQSEIQLLLLAGKLVQEGEG